MKFLDKIFKKKQMATSPQLKAAYRILPEEKMIVELYSGQLTMNNVIPYKMLLSSDSTYKTEYTMFGDLQDCIIDSLVNDVDAYLNFIKENDQLIMDKGKHVGIMSTKNQQFFIQSFKERFDDELQNQGMFTSIDDGLEFIGKKELKSKIEKVMNELTKELKTYK